jgi:periplasmic protein TonB
LRPRRAAAGHGIRAREGAKLMTQLAHSTGLFRVSRPQTPQTAAQRLFGIVFAIAMEAGIVYALLVALGYVETPKLRPPLTVVNVAPLPNDPTDPLPPPQTFEAPVVQPAVTPVIELTYVPPIPQTAISVPPPLPVPTPRQATPPSPPVVFTPARAMAATHTIPEYPFVSRRLREQGTLRLKLVVDEKGFVTDATVVNSSGFQRLDEAAVNWVKTHWRYTPAMQGAKPVRSNADAIVEFRLQ